MTHKVQIMLFIALTFFNAGAWAQESFGGSPRSFKSKISDNVPVIELSRFDNDALQAEDLLNADKGNPLRIGVSHMVNYGMDNCGTIDVLPNGDKIWRVAFKSPDAANMDLSFSKYLIPDGADLFVYNETRDYVIGSYNVRNTMDGNIFYAEAIPGDVIYLEYYEPQGAKFHGELTVDMIGHLYRDILKSASGSCACEINVACSEGDPFRKQIHSVVNITMATYDGNKFSCSGAMINNVRNDRTLYMFSAEHCYDNYKTWTFYYNDQIATCNGTTGMVKFTATGAELKAKGNRGTSSDFLLMKITGTVSSLYRDSIYFAGWNNSSVAPTIGCCIHHPAGDYKKISIPQSVSSSVSMNKFWEVSWKTTNNKGVTEGGSSGSPLLNANGLIVGSLCCGSSGCQPGGCDYPSNPNIQGLSGKDYYGRLAYAWTNGNDYATGGSNNLKRWLDPDNTGATTHYGLFYSELTAIHNTYKLNCSVSPNPTSGMVSISGDFDNPQGLCKVFDLMGRQIYTESIMLSNSTEINLGHLSEGLYMLEIQNAGKLFRSKLIISK
ncbi:MAG: T9SS type A sorting domain-containing protein [Bacteroidales bacterium]|jgi:hypothetical protein|nr:T9SS type A sorting domain-containing protein [Bacteroidales bacterium]